MTNTLFASISSWVVLIAGIAVFGWLAFEAIWALINLWSRMARAGREFVQWFPYKKQFKRWLKKQTAERYTCQKSLEDYLRSDLARNVIDHTMRASIDQEGCVRVYMHPSGIDGNTLAFIVEVDDTIPLKMRCKTCKGVFLAPSPKDIPLHLCIS